MKPMKSFTTAASLTVMLAATPALADETTTVDPAQCFTEEELANLTERLAEIEVAHGKTITLLENLNEMKAERDTINAQVAELLE